MPWNIIPLDDYPDKESRITVEVGTENIPLILHFLYNTEGEFWRMDVSDGNTGDLLLGSVPLLPGEAPAANILRQFEYLGLGMVVVLPLTDAAVHDHPELEDFISDYALVWGSDEVG